MNDKPIPERWREHYDFLGRESDNCLDVREGRQLIEELGAAEAALAEAKHRLGQEEEGHLSTIDQRDAYEDFIGNLAADLGCRKDWSSMHDHRECVEEAALGFKSQVAQLQTTISQLNEDKQDLLISAQTATALMKESQVRNKELQTTLQEQEKRQKELVAALRWLRDSIPHLEGDDNLTEPIQAADAALAVHVEEKVSNG